MNIKLYCIIPLCIIIFSCKDSKPVIPVENTQTSFEMEEEIPRYSLTLIAAGDNLFHSSIIRTHKQDNTHNFEPVYSEIKSLIQNADLAFINQETVMAGEEFGYSGYPSFNTPQALAITLAETGFNIINHANNHALDMGKDGLIATLDLWDTIPEITVVGARRDGENARVITKNNITFGFLSYCYGINGNIFTADNQNLITLINRDTIAEEIDALRPLCEILIVSMHWGGEFNKKPSKSQTDLALFISEHNADIIIGHHPHILQRFEALPRPDGKKTLCFYSLGNFVSNQWEAEGLIGAIMLVTFEKERDTLSVSNSGLIPVICHYENDYANTKVYPLYLYTEELLTKHRNRITDKNFTMNFFYSVIKRTETKMIMHPPRLRRNNLN